MPPSTRTPHILVTAGSTREKIDDVRDWGNIFTGNTGLDIARAFLNVGNVTLLTSNRQHANEFDGYSGARGMLGVETFTTHAELKSLLHERVAGESTSHTHIDVVAMTAAITDYIPTHTFRVLARSTNASGRETWTVENVDAPKVKSSYPEIAVLASQTEKLVDLFRKSWNYAGVLIKFKLEVGISDEDLLRVASASRTASDADLMVANTLAMARPPTGEGAAYLVDAKGNQRINRNALAKELVSWTMATEKMKPFATR